MLEFVSLLIGEGSLLGTTKGALASDLSSFMGERMLVTQSRQNG